jgi:membrane-bound lytic murein transglycosylase B
VAILRIKPMPVFRLSVIVFVLMMAGCTTQAARQDPVDSADLEAFANTMADRHGMDANAIAALLNDEAVHQQEIIDAISSPAEALPWYRYRRIFLTQDRIEAGLEYWQAHAALLDAVHARYGVPAEIVVAIIGVETRYGRYRGRHRVIDALRTLAFAYPPRADFFRSELEAFLILANEEGIDPREPLGSYAGAMGVPQFISSSYRAYAVDFNNNGRRDLFSEAADIIGSVGNYFAEHGWREAEPIAVPAQVNKSRVDDLLRASLKPTDTVENLFDAGVKPRQSLAFNQPARLLALETDNGTAHWVTLNNFYVITRYNHSPLYAMAVFQLAEAIREAYP